jgi:hypothetical protein
VDSIYTDFSKAIDRVRHCLHFDKMSSDVEPTRCQCFLLFLKNPLHKNERLCFRKYFGYFALSASSGL